jgi:hypothetical protein
MEVLLVDLGQVVAVQAANILGLVPGHRRSDNDKVAVTARLFLLARLLMVTIGEAGAVRIASPGRRLGGASGA